MKISRPSVLTGPARSIELRFTPTGRAVTVVHFDDTTRAESWDQMAEDIAELNEGTVISVTGFMKTRKWFDRSDAEHTQDFLAIQSWGRV